MYLTGFIGGLTEKKKKWAPWPELLEGSSSENCIVSIIFQDEDGGVIEARGYQADFNVCNFLSHLLFYLAQEGCRIFQSCRKLEPDVVIGLNT